MVVVENECNTIFRKTIRKTDLQEIERKASVPQQTQIGPQTKKTHNDTEHDPAVTYDFLFRLTACNIARNEGEILCLAGKSWN